MIDIDRTNIDPNWTPLGLPPGLPTEIKDQRQRRGYTALKCNAESRGCRFAEGNEQDSEDGEEVAVGRISQRDSSQATR